MRLADALTDDLRRAPWRGSPDPLAGHCYVASEAIYHHLLDLGWRRTDLRAMFVRVEGQPHWYVEVRLPGGPWMRLDPTGSQFTSVPYREARAKGFLTKQPSKRARVVMERMGWA